MKDSFKTFLTGYKSALIILPREPYFDQVAAGLALYLFLKGKMGVSIVCPSPMLVEFNRLVGVDKVSTEAGNRNMMVRFNGYNAEDIERVTYDIEQGQMYITVIPKTQVMPPKKEQVEISYAGVAADVAVLIGGASEKHFPLLGSEDLAGVEIVHVGIGEVSLGEGRKAVSFARPASSISEVVYELIMQNGEGEIDQDMATNLLMGIYEGSRNFTHPMVTGDTFRVASELMKAGGRMVRAEQERVQRQLEPTAAPLEVVPLEKPAVEATKAPSAWMQTPKIYKGTSVS